MDQTNIQFIEKYKHVENVEIELRIKVTKQIFDNCLKFLFSKNLENKYEDIKDDFDKENRRKTKNEIILKSNIFRNKVYLNLYEVTFAINIETPQNSFNETILSREKHRYTFYEKYFIYDLTIVNSKNNVSYEIEIEIDTIKSLHHTSEKLFSGLKKNMNVLLTCSNI